MPQGGDQSGLFANNLGANAPNFFLSDRDTNTSTNSGNDVFTLRFSDANNPSLDLLSGTVSNPFFFDFEFIRGSARFDLLSEAGGVLDGKTLTSNDAGSRIDFDLPNIAAIRFTTLSSGADAIGIERLRANELNCFLAGTRIATQNGHVAVEDIAKGDRVLTADGRAVEVRWLGQQTVDARMTHPEQVNPICISAGALAPGVPERDLYVSPDHAIGIDGILINASVLVNDQSIYQLRTMPLERFTYYHVETEAHELLLAEGCPAESFLEHSDTFGFNNGDERDARVIQAMDLPRVSSTRMLPDAIVERLSDRARTLRAWRRAG